MQDIKPFHIGIICCIAGILVLAVSLESLAQAPDIGLISYYPFTSGSLSDDWGQNHLQNHGSTPIPDLCGNANNAYYFDGEADYMTAMDLDHVNSLSFSVWFYWELETGPNSTSAIFSGDNGGWDRGLHIKQDIVNGGLLQVHDGNIPIDIVHAPIIAGVWTHVALVYDVDNIYLYMNGDLVWNKGDQPGNWNEGVWDIGSSPWDGHMHYNFKGGIDELLIYDRPLASDEIDILSNPDRWFGDCNVIGADKSSWGRLKAIYR